MQKLITQIKELHTISSQLDIPEMERNKMIGEVETFTNQFLSGLDTEKEFVEKPMNSNDLAIDLIKKPMKQLLQIYREEVAGVGINAASGKHLGYIPGGGIFVSALADFIAAVTNPFAGVYYASPGAATIENEVINWLKTIFSFPKSAIGNLASGGSVSTIVAFTAARDKHQIKNEQVPKSVVYLSEQVHHAAQKALRIIGLEDAIIRIVPMDENHKMKTGALEELIVEDTSNGLKPFLLIATAGTTDTGAVDPLDALADVAAKNNMWFHVDAAYGGFFILTSKKEIFKGIEKADSIIADPHKSMFLPYGIGAVLIKDKQAVLHSNQYFANYMQDAEIENLCDSPANVSPELTKHFRGLRLWLPLQIHGIEPFIACLEEKLLLVKYFRARIIQYGFNVGPAPDLSVSYFWYPFEENCDIRNKKLMDEIHKDGDVFLSSSIINNRFVIRVAILAFRTKIETIDKTVDMILRCFKKI